MRAVEAVLQYTTPKQEFCGNTLTVKQGMAISMDVLIERLFGAGYLRRFQVDGPGQFSVRGGIVDIYAPDMQKPHRLEFWGDEVDSIHSFDLVSQRREGAVKKIYLSPAREVLFGDTEAAARLLRTALSKAKPAYAEALADAMDGDLKALDAGTMPAAMDKYLALRYEKPATIFEYFDAPSCSSTSQAPCARPPKAWNSASERRSRACWKRVCWPRAGPFLRGHRVSAARDGEAGMPWCVKILPAPSRT